MKRRNALLLVAALLANPADAATTPASPPPDDSQELVVTAIRTGAPVWRVRSASGTLVLVGAIDEVAAGTEWRPSALAETVARANRIMFPQMVSISINPFSMIGYLAKWKRRQKLPKGESLSTMLGPADTARLARLAAQGLAPADFDRWHPLHLAFNMGDRLRKATRLMEAPSSTVRRAAGKHKVAQVPIERGSVRPLADSVFKSRLSDHLPCLTDTIAAMGAGPEGMRARSRDWAAKGIPAVLGSPSDRLGRRCWPSITRPGDQAELEGVVRRTLAAPGTTLAVLNLETLARSGGLLDRLAASGLAVTGPAWR